MNTIFTFKAVDLLRLVHGALGFAISAGDADRISYCKDVLDHLEVYLFSEYRIYDPDDEFTLTIDE